MCNLNSKAQHASPIWASTQKTVSSKSTARLHRYVPTLCGTSNPLLFYDFPFSSHFPLKGKQHFLSVFLRAKKKIIPTAAQFFFTTVLKCLCLHAHLEWKWHSGSLESVVSLVIQTFSTSFSAGIFKTTHVIFSKWVMEGNHIHPVSLPPQNNLT